MNTPTPRTDTEIEEMVNGLKHMADDHLCCRATVLDAIELLNGLKRERDQLRKVADEFARQSPGDDKWLMADYRDLPHVRAKGKTK